MDPNLRITNKEIIFIYNADSGKLNGLLDMAHKILMPSHYTCDLCKLTHNNFSENKMWKNFRENLKGWSFLFYHKDEYEEKFSALLYYPCIIMQKPSFKTLFTHKELAAMGNTETLISNLKERLSLC